MIDTNNCYTLPELSELLGISQSAVLDLIADFLADKDEDERRHYLCTTNIHALNTNTE